MHAPKPTQILWMVGAAVFMLAIVHSLGAGRPAAEWVSGTVATAFLASGPQNHGRLSLRDHMKIAEQSWAKTVRQRHELLQNDWADPENITLFPAVDYDSYQVTPYSIWDFVPASYSCPHEMERIGRMGDGGKWVCGMSMYENLPADRPCIIYSFGVQTESSYEQEMLDRTHCEIWGYDFSVLEFGPQLSAEHRSRAHFTQAGIAGETDQSQSPPFFSIQDLMAINGHVYIDILKIDIEFYEFAALRSLANAFPAAAGLSFPIGQMLIEIHIFGDENVRVTDPVGWASGTAKAFTSGEFLNWWEMLEARGMRPAFTEPNLLYTTLNIESGDPRLAEYTLINNMDPRSAIFQGLTG